MIACPYRTGNNQVIELQHRQGLRSPSTSPRGVIISQTYSPAKVSDCPLRSQFALFAAELPEHMRWLGAGTALPTRFA